MGQSPCGSCPGQACSCICCQKLGGTENLNRTRDDGVSSVLLGPLPSLPFAGLAGYSYASQEAKAEAAYPETAASAGPCRCSSAGTVIPFHRTPLSSICVATSSRESGTMELADCVKLVN